MSNLLFYIYDTLQALLLFLGFGVSVLGVGFGFLPSLFSYFNSAIILILFFLLIFKRKKKEMFFENSLEILYCLIAPFIYLSLVFNTNSKITTSENIVLENSQSYNLFAWISLSIYWLIRIIPKKFFKTEKIFTIVSKISIYFCLIVLSLFIWKDHSFILAKIGETDPSYDPRFSNFSLMLYYIVPYLIGARRLNLIQNIQINEYEVDDFYDCLKSFRIVIILFLGLIAINLFQKTDYGIRLRLQFMDADINRYSEEYKVDKTLLQAILYTNYKHYLNPIKFLAEYIALGFWVFDEKNNLGWAENFSVSVGSAQIQPTTAQKAILLGMLNYTNQSGYYDKRYRAAIVEIKPDWKIKNATLKLKTIHLDPIHPFQVAMELVDPETNIEYCAYILYLYQSQWKSKNYDISDRPDILASLYQIGFEKSIPKPNPVSNDYGKQVKEAYEYLSQESIIK